MLIHPNFSVDDKNNFDKEDSRYWTTDSSFRCYCMILSLAKVRRLTKSCIKLLCKKAMPIIWEFLSSDIFLFGVKWKSHD